MNNNPTYTVKRTRPFASYLCCSFTLSITMLLAAPAAAQDARTRQYLKAALIRPLRTLFNRNATVQKTALLTLTLGAILFLAHPAHAQFIGDRMRITTQHGTEITGQIKSLDNTSLTILMDYSRELSIAYADMARLQRSLGIRSYYRDGAKAGLVVGEGGSIIAAAVAQEGGVAALLGIGFFHTDAHPGGHDFRRSNQGRAMETFGHSRSERRVHYVGYWRSIRSVAWPWETVCGITDSRRRGTHRENEDLR